jgi:hypothetical protein
MNKLGSDMPKKAGTISDIEQNSKHDGQQGNLTLA